MLPGTDGVQILQQLRSASATRDIPIIMANAKGTEYDKVLCLDLTQKQKAEALRREFTANVSHELKTPLHSISGYAELLKSSLVLPEDAAGNFLLPRNWPG